MLVFLDESGDTGRKIDGGSSAYFVVSLVLFLDREEALRCDKRIDLLRHELGLSADYEFHFSNNSKRVRRAFLEAVCPYAFSVITVAINKQPSKLYGEGFNTKESFYKYACQMVLTNALPYLDHATLVIDRSGSATFLGALKRYIRTKLQDQDRTKIKHMKAQDSAANNLLQLVDYCVGVSNRKVQCKYDWQTYYGYISGHEQSWQEWPR